MILKATHGLNPKVVEEVKMSPSEGLVGLVHETREAVQASKMQDHPRFKHFPQTNESRFSSFLGVPLVEHRKSFGVVVAHTENSRVFVDNEIELLKAIAVQISSLVSKALLLKQLDLDRYYGLLELGEKHGVFKRVGNRIAIGGSNVYPKSILSDPEKYFTDEVMAKLEEAARTEYSYGN